MTFHEFAALAMGFSTGTLFFAIMFAVMMRSK